MLVKIDNNKVENPKPYEVKQLSISEKSVACHQLAYYGQLMDERN